MQNYWFYTQIEFYLPHFTPLGVIVSSSLESSAAWRNHCKFRGFIWSSSAALSGVASVKHQTQFSIKRKTAIWDDNPFIAVSNRISISKTNTECVKNLEKSSTVYNVEQTVMVQMKLMVKKKEFNFIYGTNNANVSSRYDWMHLLFFSSL